MVIATSDIVHLRLVEEFPKAVAGRSDEGGARFNLLLNAVVYPECDPFNNRPVTSPLQGNIQCCAVVRGKMSVAMILWG